MATSSVAASQPLTMSTPGSRRLTTRRAATALGGALTLTTRRSATMAAISPGGGAQWRAATVAYVAASLMVAMLPFRGHAEAQRRAVTAPDVAASSTMAAISPFRGHAEA